MKINKINVYGFEPALRGMRNPMNSWGNSDSKLCADYDCYDCPYFDTVMCSTRSYEEGFMLGENDLKLAQNLIKAGTEHCKFMRQIQVWMDIEMPRYWWSEFDTYKIGTTANSCSTMHKLFSKTEPELDFSMFEYHIKDENDLLTTITKLNNLRQEFLYTETPITQKEKDKILRRAKQLLPEGFLQMRTVNTNYATLRNILLQRKNHRLVEEWQDTFCATLTTLPYAKELIFCGVEDEYGRFININE